MDTHEGFNSQSIYISGPGIWIRWKNEVDRVAEVTYFLLTTVAGTMYIFCN